MVPPYDVGDGGAGVSGRHPQRNGRRRGAKKGGGAARGGESGRLQSPPRASIGLNCAGTSTSGEMGRRNCQIAHRRRSRSPPRLKLCGNGWLSCCRRLRAQAGRTPMIGGSCLKRLSICVYLMETGRAWNRLPPQFPPWQTVYAQLCRWRATGI